MNVAIDKIREICDRVAGSMGLEVVEVEFKGGAGKQGRVLRITIDRVPQSGVAGGNTSDSQMNVLSPRTARQPAQASAAENVVETSVPTASPVALGEDPDAEDIGLSQGGVTLEDCANLSREVSAILDVEDPVAVDDYVLEVSSPGLDRKLLKPADYQRFTGSMVKLQTRQPIGVTEKSKGNRFFEGRLESFREGRLTLDTSQAGSKSKQKKGAAAAPKAGGKIEIDINNVEKANLVPEI